MIKPSKNIVKGLFPDISVFLIGTLLQFITIYLGIPILHNKGLTTLGSWMILSIPLIFIPVITGGIIILKFEKSSLKLSDRLRLHRLKKNDLKWITIGFLIMILGSGISFVICTKFGLKTNPPFARNVEPWINGNTWMFALFAIYWPINILGENFVWRGVILPRMENYFGNFGWLFNSLLWGIFHLAFGLGNLIVLISTLIAVPLVTQKTQNTWSGIILHATLSGPGFIALAFGLMR